MMQAPVTSTLPWFGTAILSLCLASCQTRADRLRQQHFEEEYARLVAAEKANPTKWAIKRDLARCLGGWLEFSPEGEPIRVLGLDRPIEAYRKYYSDPDASYRVWATRPGMPKFTLEWYRFLSECHWFAMRASQKEDKYAEIADKFYRMAKSTDDFAHMRAMGEAGELVYRSFQVDR